MMRNARAILKTEKNALSENDSATMSESKTFQLGRAGGRESCAREFASQDPERARAYVDHQRTRGARVRTRS